LKPVAAISLLLIFCTFLSCVEPFDPPEISNPEEILIIEGTLDAPEGEAKVILSRIRNLSSTAADTLGARVSGADVRITVDGNAYTLTESETGIYTGLLPVQYGSFAGLTVNVFGKIYESDIVTLQPVPDIDSITFEADENAVRIEVTTGDPTAVNRYYQWTYVETAEYRTQFSSDYYFDGNEVQQRMNEQQFYCWKTTPSSNILVATTEGLAENLIFKYPVVRLPANSWKKERKYSILLNQFSISEEAYIFLNELENNTENVGSLFDPQPGRIVGNVRCVTNPEEYVLGLFSARDKKSQRFFLDSRELPDYPSVLPVCSLQSFDTLSVQEVYNLNGPRDLMGAILTPAGMIIGYTRAFEQKCQDCRVLRGGSNSKPPYWE